MSINRHISYAQAAMISKWQNSRMLRATVWSLSTLIFGQTLRVVSTLIISRLLSPDVFGVMTIVFILQSLVYMLCDVGLVQLVMRSKRVEHTDFLSTVWTVQILRGFVIWGISLVVALLMIIAGSNGLFPVGSVWNAPELPALIAVTAFGTVIGGFQSTRVLIAYRDMNVKPIALIELTAQATGIVALILLAIFFKTAWVFVISGLVTSVTATLLGHLILAGPRDRLGWEKATLLEIYEAGGWIILGSLSYFASANADRLLLAAWITPTELGLYSIPLNLIGLIEMVGLRMVTSILQPALNETARIAPSVLGKQLHRHRMLFDAGYLFIAGMLFVVAKPLILLMYDPRYAGAGHILQMLSLLLVFSRYQHIIGAVYIALGQPRLMAGVSVVRLIAILIFLPLGFYLWSFEGALIGIVLHQVPGVIAIFWINRRYNLNNMWLELLVLPSWLVGAAVGLGSLTFLRLFH